MQGGGVGPTRTRLAAEDAVEVGALLVSAAGLDSVALRALSLENLGTLSLRHVV